MSGEKYFVKLYQKSEPEPVMKTICRSRSHLKKYQEPEPLGEKISSRSRLKKKSGGGAAKKFAGSPALTKCNELID